MPRKEFPKTVKVAVIKRATKDGIVFCEGCGALAKKWEIDHITPDGLFGEPTLENAKLLCQICHSEKTKKDVKNIAQAKRREARHLGVRKKPTLMSRGFTKYEKPTKIDKSVFALPRKNMFEDAK
jgi:5-methylcytosine-specific restriction endonuclease McrA